MIVQRLRKKKHWSQEHLATISGLSLRTIQRIEKGQKVSMESLTSLAAVFEIEVRELSQEFMAIDKQANAWKQKPAWLRFWFFGSNTWWLRNKKEAIYFEVFLVLVAITFLIGGLFQTGNNPIPLLSLSLTCFISAYVWSITIRLADKYAVWQSGK